MQIVPIVGDKYLNEYQVLNVGIRKDTNWLSTRIVSTDRDISSCNAITFFALSSPFLARWYKYALDAPVIAVSEPDKNAAINSNITIPIMNSRWKMKNPAC